MSAKALPDVILPLFACGYRILVGRYTDAPLWRVGLTGMLLGYLMVFVAVGG
jgi:hypothetical protein